MTATNLPETMTYWAKGVNNGTGGISWAVGVAVPARHKDKTEAIRTPDGRIVDSSRVFYSEAVLEIGDMIALGDFSSTPQPSKDALPVLVVQSNPSMSTLAKMMV